MTKYTLQVDEEAGLQVVQDEQGLSFDELPELAMSMDGLSEFERYQAARLLRSASRRPKTQVTDLRHLAREPFFTAGSKSEDDVQFCLEIYDASHQSAEVVLEYPAEDKNARHWFGFSAVSQSADELSSQRRKNNVVRLIFKLGRQEISALLKLCHVLPELSG